MISASVWNYFFVTETWQRRESATILPKEDLKEADGATGHGVGMGEAEAGADPILTETPVESTLTQWKSLLGNASVRSTLLLNTRYSVLFIPPGTPSYS